MRLLHGEGDFAFILLALLCGKKRGSFFSTVVRLRYGEGGFVYNYLKKEEVLLLSCSCCFVEEWKCVFSHSGFLAKVTVGMRDFVHNRDSTHWLPNEVSAKFCVLLTVRIGIIQINNQLEAQSLTHTHTHIYIYIYISILYMFRAIQCSSSGESIESIQHLV